MIRSTICMAARAAGALAIAVLSGPAQRAALEPFADRVVGTIADLPALLESAEAPEPVSSRAMSPPC